MSRDAEPMTDEELAEIRSVTDGATPGPWFLAYATVLDRPRTQEFMRLEREIPEDAPEAAYEKLPDATICHVPVIAGDTPTAQGARDGEFIAIARVAVPKLLDEVERLRLLAADRWAITAFRDAITAFRDASDEADALIKERALLRAELDEQHNAILFLRAALAEAIDIFNRTWCPEHGHAPSPAQIDRMDALEKLVADEVKKLDDDRRLRSP